MNPIIQFLASTPGRVARAVAGVALIAVGLAGIGGGAGMAVAAVGVVPVAAGVFDFCLLAPLFGHPFSGGRIRGAR